MVTCSRLMSLVVRHLKKFYGPRRDETEPVVHRKAVELIPTELRSASVTSACVKPTDRRVETHKTATEETTTDIDSVGRWRSGVPVRDWNLLKTAQVVWGFLMCPWRRIIQVGKFVYLATNHRVSCECRIAPHVTTDYYWVRFSGGCECPNWRRRGDGAAPEVQLTTSIEGGA